MNNNQSGFSLVELMLAMLISLVIIGGVMGLYINTRDTQRASQQQMEMVADARFAIQAISYDLMHAGSWGGTMMNSNMYCADGDGRCPASDQLPQATGDCAAFDYINLSQPVVGFDDSNPYGATCASNSYRAETDILQVKYADSSTVEKASLAADTAYVRSNPTGGSVFLGAYPDHIELTSWKDGLPYDVYTKNHPLRSNIYYISDFTDVAGDGLPSLRKVYLTSGPEFTEEVLLSGIEDLQLQYGIVDGVNTNPGDFKSVVSYVSADMISTDLDWQNVKAVKIWVLMRSARQDRDDIGGSQTFTIAGKPAQTFDDGYRRFLVSGVVQLKNTNRLDESVAAGSNI